MDAVDFVQTRGGYRTSKNRVSIGLSLTPARADRIRQLANQAGVSLAEAIGRLIDRASDEGSIPEVVDEVDGSIA